MEEIQCALLGFGSAALPGSERTTVSASLRSLLHPTEYQLLMDVIPLGSIYAELRAFVSDVTVGRCDGYLASAIGIGISKYLQQYEAEVRDVSTAASLEALRTGHGETFQFLRRLMHHAEEPEVLCIVAQQLVSTLDIPLSVRSVVGDRVAMATLFVTAHYVAHGVVLDGRKADFFVRTEVDGNGDESEYPLRETFQLNKRLLPCGIPAELGQRILLTGRERKLLREQLALREDRNGALLQERDDAEVAQAIFSSIFSPALTRDGRLAVEELEVRVVAAKSVWSRSLWLLVGESSQLSVICGCLRDMYLGHRGDFWSMFVDLTFATLAQSAASADHRMQTNTGRLVVESYRRALHDSQLMSVKEVAELFAMRWEPSGTVPSGGGIEEAAAMMIGRIRQISLTCDLPATSMLVISSVALDRYHELLHFQLSVRFALHGTHLTRKIIRELTTTLSKSSNRKSEVFNTMAHQFLNRMSRVLQFVTFVLTSVGYYFQVDVIAAHFTTLEENMRRYVTSVDDAKRVHDQFMLAVGEGIFLIDDDDTSLLDAIFGCCRSALMLFGLTSRSEGLMARLLQSGSGGAAVGRGEIPAELQAALSQLEKNQREITSALALHLSTSLQPSERALWARLDFNKYFSGALLKPKGLPLSLGIQSEAPAARLATPSTFSRLQSTAIGNQPAVQSF